MSSGPHRRTLEQFADAANDPELFAPLASGGHVLVAPRGALAERFAISASALHYRIRSLRNADLVEDTPGRLVLRTQAIQARAAGRVISFPSRAQRPSLAAVEDTFEVAMAADGTPDWVHPDDGRPASLSDVQSAAGWRSRGTAHYHRQRLRLADAPLEPAEPSSAEPLYLAALTAAVESLTQLATIATTARHLDMASSALGCIDELSQLAATHLTSASSRLDDAVSARTNPEEPSGPREPSRDEPASWSRLGTSTQSSSEVETEFSGQTQNKPRDETATPTRDNSPRSGTTESEPETPPEDRAFGVPLPDWEQAEWPSLIAPIAHACRERRRPEPEFRSFLIERAQQWPRSYLTRAAELLATDIRRDSGMWDPAAVFAKAIMTGRERYFPVAIPPVDRRPERLAQIRARTADHLRSAGGDPVLLAHLLHGATQGDRDALALAVTLVHDALDQSQIAQFDVAVLDETEATGQPLSSIEDLLVHRPQEPS